MRPVLYSTNPWFAMDIANKYRNGQHFCWCCEHFDITKAPAASASAMIAPSSNPKGIYEQLFKDVSFEDKHSALLKGYRSNVIPRAPIDTAGRLLTVPRRDRAGYGPEMQIEALMPGEFDVIEFGS